MPNNYTTPDEIRAAVPDGIRQTTTKYDAIMYQLATRISRFFDHKTGRVFYPQYQVRHYHGDGSTELWIDDLIELTTIEYSKDNGLTYTAYTSDDYWLTVAGDDNSKKSYTLIKANVNTAAAISYFPAGQRSIKITGYWGYCEDRDEVFEASGDTVQSNPLSDSETSLTVSDADGLNLWSVAPRFQLGSMIKIETEYIEITGIDATDNKLTIVRGRNGTTAAAHVQATPITVWRPPEPVAQAAIIQAVRQMERGFQGFSDARATVDIGQLFYMREIDPEAASYLWPFVEMRG